MEFEVGELRPRKRRPVVEAGVCYGKYGLGRRKRGVEAGEDEAWSLRPKR